MSLYERVVDLSNKRNFKSVRDLSIAAGMSQNALYSWKTQSPSADNLNAVAKILGVSADYLLGNTDDMYSNQNDNQLDIKNAPILAYDGKPVSDETRDILERILEMETHK
ncbi:helix-turn-helix domain-containing protein [Weissella paramesenteroides]|uniref:Toxin-antitoxin system, antitoxin component, Xre family n=1 Tax=Weissella paramesenteroides ATCC 33313 TaxID=585506 RepID=C5R837_WEIPA|nr:helix-turn-helix transcriptional regulator [Weissella paramesenteroides]EER75621.1 toxin-antitoxin system, antitoxin component, Xre family [Weissella paramesenteroides ATCC 33313]